MIATAKDRSLESVIDLDTKADKFSTKVANFISNNYAKINAANAAVYLALTVATFTQPLPAIVPDYAAHIGVYAGLAATFERALAARNTEIMDKYSALIAIISGAAIANGLEFYQSTLPDRVTSAVDVISGTLGAGIGALAWPFYEAHIEKDPYEAYLEKNQIK